MKLFFHFSFYRGLAYLRSCLFKTSHSINWPSEILLPRLNVQLVTSSQIKEDHTRLVCHARAWEETEIPWGRVKVMLHGTIRNDDFWGNTALQHCCDIVSNGCNAVPTLQRCVELKIVVAKSPVQHHLKTESRCWKLISTRKQYAIPINIFDCDYTYNIILTPIIITWNNQAYSKPFSVSAMAVEGEIFQRKPIENLSVTFSFLNSL